MDKLDADIIIKASGDYPPSAVFVYNVVSSLMDEGAAAARNGCPHGTVLVADEQTAGRGRRGRIWESKSALGLYFVTVYQDDYIRPAGPFLPLLCGLAVCESVRRAGCREATIKWPNDVIINERKIAGTLIERITDPCAYVIGIGVNVGHQPADFSEELRDMATSLYIETGKRIPRNLLAGLLIEAISANVDEFRKLGCSTTVRRYKNLCSTIGKPVEVITDKEQFSGIAADIYADGALVIKSKEGVKKIYAGDVKIKQRS